MEKKKRELDDLLNRYLDGNLSEADVRVLSTQIEESAEVRERYWELASIHGMVEQTMQSVSLQATTGKESAEQERRPRASGLSRIKTGIAGLFFSQHLFSQVPSGVSYVLENRDIMKRAPCRPPRFYRPLWFQRVFLLR